MLKKEEWLRWKPIDNLAKQYSIASIIVDNTEGFKLTLFDVNNRNKKVCILFDSVELYCREIKSLTLKRLHILGEQYSVEFVTSWTFFKVINSNYVQLIADQSYGAIPAEWLTHFSIRAVDSWVDIVNRGEPMVELI